MDLNAEVSGTIHGIKHHYVNFKPAQISMSVRMVLIVVVKMHTALMLMATTLVPAHLDSLEMDRYAVV